MLFKYSIPLILSVTFVKKKNLKINDILKCNINYYFSIVSSNEYYTRMSVTSHYIQICIYDNG